jgi:hypothetical protein
MASTIIETDPQTGVDQPVSVIRNNFVRAKQEIEALQTDKFDKNGGPLSGIMQLASFSSGDLPSAITNLGGVAMVVDAGPTPIPVYSNGVNWVKFSDNAIVV